MEYQGICHKMRARVGDTSETLDGRLAVDVDYSLVVEPFECNLTPHLQKTMRLAWTGKIFCLSCGAKTPKSYSQGHCFKCFKTKASCDMCIMKPETCHHHLGTCREESFAQEVCFNPHVVYLANSSALKVGITRHSQMPTRWLDQGATQALPIIQTATRFLSGVVEQMIAQRIADKTDWRAMLKGEAVPIDLPSLRDELLLHYADDLKHLQHAYPDQIGMLEGQHVREFAYPVIEYPKKVSAHNFDKTPVIEGTLLGIKGQYLMLDTGVLNLGKFGGYELSVTVG
jgi:hypothetical protein